MKAVQKRTKSSDDLNDRRDEAIRLAYDTQAILVGASRIMDEHFEESDDMLYVLRMIDVSIERLGQIAETTDLIGRAAPMAEAANG
jgi:hypothetical protein